MIDNRDEMNAAWDEFMTWCKGITEFKDVAES